MDANTASTVPTPEELNAELLPVPEPPEQPESPQPPGFEESIEIALRHVKARRGGDLIGVLLVGSAARKAVTPHSDIDLLGVVKGAADRHEILRVGERLADIRYRGHKELDEELTYSPRLPPLLRKSRILYDHDGVAARLVEKAHQRFRQGPPPCSINEQIRLKAECLHWIGKARDLVERPPTAHYLLQLFYEDFVHAFFRLRGLWVTAPVDVQRFMYSRDAALAELAARFLTASTLADRLNFAQQLADQLCKDVPNPARID